MQTEKQCCTHRTGLVGAALRVGATLDFCDSPVTIMVTIMEVKIFVILYVSLWLFVCVFFLMCLFMHLLMCLCLRMCWFWVLAYVFVLSTGLCVRFECWSLQCVLHNIDNSFIPVPKHKTQTKVHVYMFISHRKWVRASHYSHHHQLFLQTHTSTYIY